METTMPDGTALRAPERGFQRTPDPAVTACVAKVTMAPTSKRAGALKLSVLSPCSEDWNAMRGDERVRFCGQCRQNVYNLAAMTEAEARALVGGDKQACVRMFLRGDGTAITRSCLPMIEAARGRVLALAAGLEPLAAGF
jgi:hypothetical protein